MAQLSMNTSPVCEVSRDRVIKRWALQTAGSLQQAGTARTLLQSPTAQTLADSTIFQVTSLPAPRLTGCGLTALC